MKWPQVVLVIDMISPWDFPGAEEVARDAPTTIGAIEYLREQAGLRIVYVNDLSGGFHGSAERAYETAMASQRPDLVEPIKPDARNDFLHKGQHSGFYGTPLAHLLHEYSAKEVIFTGQVLEQCVLYTALDAHVRDYEVTVVTDAVLSMDKRLGSAALEMIGHNMGGNLVSSQELKA